MSRSRARSRKCQQRVTFSRAWDAEVRLRGKMQTVDAPMTSHAHIFFMFFRKVVKP